MQVASIPAGHLTDDQARDLMLDVAVAGALPWADAGFLTAEVERDAIAASDQAARVRVQGIVDDFCAAMMQDAEAIADHVGASPAQRARFLLARIRSFMTRFDRLMGTAGHPGHG